MSRHGAAVDRTEEWAALRQQHLRAHGDRPPSSARGVHHLALLSSDGPDLGDYAEVLGGMHHLAISVTPDRWEHLRGKLAAKGSPRRR